MGPKRNNVTAVTAVGMFARNVLRPTRISRARVKDSDGARVAEEKGLAIPRAKEKEEKEKDRARTKGKEETAV